MTWSVFEKQRFTETIKNLFKGATDELADLAIRTLEVKRGLDVAILALEDIARNSDSGFVPTIKTIVATVNDIEARRNPPPPKSPEKRVSWGEFRKRVLNGEESVSPAALAIVQSSERVEDLLRQGADREPGQEG